MWRPRFPCVDDGLVLTHDRMLRGFNVCAEVVPQPGDDLGLIIELRLQSFLGKTVPAPLKFGFGLPGFFPGTAAVSGAAYRNRTDDLRITRRITFVHSCPPLTSGPGCVLVSGR